MIHTKCFERRNMFVCTREIQNLLYITSEYLSLSSKTSHSSRTFLRPILFSSLVYKIIYEPECGCWFISLLYNVFIFLVALQQKRIAVKKRVCLMLKQKDVLLSFYTRLWYQFCVI